MEIKSIDKFVLIMPSREGVIKSWWSTDWGYFEKPKCL